MDYDIHSYVSNRVYLQLIILSSMKNTNFNVETNQSFCNNPDIFFAILHI